MVSLDPALMMKVIFLTLCIFVSCTQAISISEQRGLNSSKTNMQEQQLFAVENYGSIKGAMKFQRKAEESNNEEKDELPYDSIKAEGGVGEGVSSGGGGRGGGEEEGGGAGKGGSWGGRSGSYVINQPHGDGSGNSAPSLSSWITNLCVALTLILIFFFPC